MPEIITEADVVLARSLPALRNEMRQRIALANRKQKRDPEWIAQMNELGELTESAVVAWNRVVAEQKRRKALKHEEANATQKGTTSTGEVTA